MGPISTLSIGSKLANTIENIGEDGKCRQHDLEFAILIPFNEVGKREQHHGQNAPLMTKVCNERECGETKVANELLLRTHDNA